MKGSYPATGELGVVCVSGVDRSIYSTGLWKGSLSGVRSGTGSRVYTVVCELGGGNGSGSE